MTVSEWTLHEGDCLDILPSIRSGSVDAIITDPPFFMPAEHYQATQSWGRKWSDTSVMLAWYRQVITEMRRIVKPSGHVLTFCDRTSYAVFLPPTFERFSKIDCLVWDKGRPGMGNPWRHQTELILAACDSNAYKVGGGGGVDILRVPPTNGADREHPVEKPRELLAALVRATCPKGGLVLDPFAGSGTTLEAAVMEGCEAIGIEMSADYCEIIRRRMQHIQEVLL